MSTGIRVTDKASLPIVDAFLGIRSQGVTAVGPISFSDVIQLFLASELGDVSASMRMETWAALNAIPPTRNGQPAEVPLTDAGTHTDPVTGTAGVANSGVFRGSLSPLGWRRVGNYNDASAISAETTAARQGQASLLANVASIGRRAPSILASVGGTADAITATDALSTAGESDDPSTTYILIPAATNTGPVTLSVNGNTARQVRPFENGAFLAAGDLVAGNYYVLTSDGSRYRVISPLGASAVRKLDIDALTTAVNGKLTNSVSTGRALGRKTAGTGAAEELAPVRGISIDATGIGLADMAQATFKGRVAGAGTGTPTDMSAAQAKAALDLNKADVGLSQANDTSDAQKAATGPIADAINAKLTNNFATNRVLGRKTAGTGVAEELAAVRGISVDATGIGLADMPEARFKGRVAGSGTGTPTDMTAAQAKAALALTKADVGLTNAADLLPSLYPVSEAQAEAIATAIAPLANADDVASAISDAVEPLATTDDLEAVAGVATTAIAGVAAMDIVSAVAKTALVDADDVAIRDSQAGPGDNPRKRSTVGDVRRAVMGIDATSTSALVKLGDTDGKAALEIGQDGHLARADVTGKLRRDHRPGQRNQLDATGWLTYAAAADTYPGGASPASLTYIRQYYLETTFFFPVFGQSLAGGAQDVLSDLAISTKGSMPYPNHALMPSVGRKPSGVAFDTFVSAYEWDGTASNPATETINAPMLNQMIATLFARTGVMPTMAAAAFSQGSRAWPQLGPGTEAWAHFVQGLRNSVQASHNIGRNCVVPAVTILWGEQNRVAALDAGTIRAHYLNMARQIKAAVREITGQEFDPVIFISVPANSVSNADREFPHITVPASLHGVEGIRVLTPNYIYPVAQNVHPTAAAYNKMGKDIGKAILQECFGPGYAPLRFLPERLRWISNTQFELPCDVSAPPIVVDTSGAVVSVPAWGNAGFQLFDRTGEITISSVTAVADANLDGSPVKNLRFDLATPTAGAPRLSYAMRNDGTGINAGPLNGARGLIRDSGTDLQKWALPMFAHLAAY